jgi:hypothetical protein
MWGKTLWGKETPLLCVYLVSNGPRSLKLLIRMLGARFASPSLRIPSYTP